jgi:hypothetical protein
VFGCTPAVSAGNSEIFFNLQKYNMFGWSRTAQINPTAPPFYLVARSQVCIGSADCFPDDEEFNDAYAYA